MTIPPDKDPMGSAMIDYLTGDHDENIIVMSDISEDDLIPVDYLFRDFDQMPEIEQKALTMCNGSVLDVGAGSGSHSLFLQNKGMDVTALDISPNACSCCRQRGVRNVINSDIMTFLSEKRYDTILLMMNGIGFTGTLHGLDSFFTKAKQLLNPGGQILLDSSDIKYMFEDEDEEVIEEVFSANAPYYGEVTYIMEYKDITGNPFSWLFVDPGTLTTMAEKHGFKCTVLHKGKNNDYLAQITFQS